MDKLQNLKENVNGIHRALKTSFSKVRSELTEHLDTINQNTNEMQVLYGYLSELEHKMDKLSERIDEISITKPSLKEEFNVELSVREEEIFLALYTASKAKTAKEIANLLSLTEEIVNSYKYKLLAKGIPIKEDIIEGVSYISLDRTFKDLQARKNLINVNEHVLEQFAKIRF